MKHAAQLHRALLLGFCLLALPLLSPVAQAQGYVAAEGGGSINGGTWAAEVFAWMLQKAGGPGNVAILGVSGADTQAAAKFQAAGAAAVVNLAITAANANDPAVYATLSQADVVWMRGGNQANYVQWWKGTLTEQAIREVFQKGGAVGGTSAGCAVLGELIYDSIGGSVSPKTALQNPWTTQITFTDDFLQLTPGVLYDTHFTERGRIARLAVMLARAEIELGQSFLGLGVDDRTAFCVSPDGTAEVIGEGAVTVLRRGTQSEVALVPNRAPIITDLVVDQMVAGYRYDLPSQSVIARPAHATLVEPPGAHPSFNGQVLAGSNPASNSLGQWEVLDFGDDVALFNGKLAVVPGTGDLGRTVVSTRVWDSTAFDENRVGGVQYALALHPHSLGVYLDGGTQAFARPDGYLTSLPPAGGAESSLVVLDSYGIVSRAFSQAVSGGGSTGPRQSVALEGARLHLLRQGASYNALTHSVDLSAPYGSGTPGCMGAHTLVGQGVPRLGTQFGVAAGGAAAGGVGVLYVGNTPDWNGSDPLGLGVTLHLSPFSTLLVPSTLVAGGSGSADMPLALPTLPSLAGLTLHAQALWVWPFGPCVPSSSGLSSSNGLAFTLVP